MDRRSFLKNLFKVAAYSQVAGLTDSFSGETDADKRSGQGEQVIRRPWKRTGLSLPLLTFRLKDLPRKDGRIDVGTAEQMIAESLEHGCNCFDTDQTCAADPEQTGKILKQYSADTYYLSASLSICELKTEADAERIFQEQLRRLGTGYFDFYFIRDLTAAGHDALQELHVPDFLEKQKAEGRIRRAGFSSSAEGEQLEKTADLHAWDAARITLNVQDWENGQNKRYEILTKRGIPIFAEHPLKGGTLANWNEAARKILSEGDPGLGPASWGLRYAGSLPNVLTVLCGMSSPEQLSENLRTFIHFTPLTAVERETLGEAVKEYRKTNAVPCPGRCWRPCPQKIDIRKS